MKNSDLDYSLHYKIWHQDTKESLENDINSNISFLKDHSLFPKNKNARILDIGCGMGRLLLAFKTEGYHSLVGVDIDQKQIEVAKRQNLDVYQEDAIDFLDKQDDKFDCILMFDILEHIDKDYQIILFRAIQKSINNNGMIAIRVPNALSPTFAYYRYLDFTHNISYTKTSIEFLLHNAGFNYFIHRPTHPENETIRKLKKPFADLLLAEFGIKEPILTPNILSIVFKSEQAMIQYASYSIPVDNNYFTIKKPAMRIKKIVKYLLPYGIVKLISYLRNR